MLYLTVMLVFLCFAAIAMTVNEGLWNNTISLLNIMLAGILAIFGGVPLGNFLLRQSGKPPEFAWYFVFAGMWIIFALSVTAMHFVTSSSSRVRVRFLPVLDKVLGRAFRPLLWNVCPSKRENGLSAMRRIGKRRRLSMPERLFEGSSRVLCKGKSRIALFLVSDEMLFESGRVLLLFHHSFLLRLDQQWPT